MKTKTPKAEMDMNRHEDIYTVPEVAKLIKSSEAYVYELINAGLLPALKLGRLKVRRPALLTFMRKYDGYDLTNPRKIIPLERSKKVV